MTEHQLQVTCAQYLDLALPQDAVWFAIPNGSHRHKAVAGKLKAEGVKAGIPDLCIIYQGRAIFIELKTKKGSLSPAQKTMQLRLTLAGCPVFKICRSLEELAAFVGVIVPLKVAV